jgi:hypothetical protein
MSIQLVGSSVAALFAMTDISSATFSLNALTSGWSRIAFLLFDHTPGAHARFSFLPTLLGLLPSMHADAPPHVLDCR